MVSFRGKKKKAWATTRSISFRGLIQNFRPASPPLSYAESPPPRGPSLPSFGTDYGTVAIPQYSAKKTEPLFSLDAKDAF